jgi:hypothetical protein
MELGSYFLFLQEQIKDIILIIELNQHIRGPSPHRQIPDLHKRLPPCLCTHDPLHRTKPCGSTDSDWAADLDNRKSTGTCLFM